MDKPNNFDAIIIGTGAAGLSAALHLAPLNVLVITKTSVLDSGSTKWAQGGIAAAVAENDSPESHIQDSLTASAGSADPAAVTALCTKGPAAIKWLDSIGMEFDRTYNGGIKK